MRIRIFVSTSGYDDNDTDYDGLAIGPHLQKSSQLLISTYMYQCPVEAMQIFLWTGKWIRQAL